MTRRATVIALALLALACAACERPDAPMHEGRWRAWLDSPGGELPFGLELQHESGELRAFFTNGDERLAISRATLDGRRLRLVVEQYDSWIEAELDDRGRRLDGDWYKTSGPDKRAHLAFHAVAGPAPRFAPDDSGAEPAARVDGRWLVDFESDEAPAVAVLETRSDGLLLGTFLTTTGDYRYLAGRIDGGRLRLSCFDGAHAFLFDARVLEDGTLAGDFWSRDTWHETWTARTDADAELPDAFGLTGWIDGIDLADVVYPDLEGRLRSLADAEFAGRARILEVFGSWCPNCNDAARYLAELDRRYRDAGLSIVGLAFEMTGEFERDAEQVRRYAAHHGLDFPILVAGVSDKARASETFPLVDRIRSYPTTIFLHGDGRIRAVHQGYTGPATGAPYAELRSRFAALVEELLAEGAQDR